MRESTESVKLLFQQFFLCLERLKKFWENQLKFWKGFLPPNESF